MVSKLKVYVASSWRNGYQPGVVAALRSLGHEVYDFRAPPPPGIPDGFRWSEIDGGWGGWSPAQWREALKHPVARRGYASDRAGMDWADCCVLVLPSGRSAHMEAAFMAARGKPVFTLALEKVEPDLMNLLLGPADHIRTTMGELFDALERAEPPRIAVHMTPGGPVVVNGVECRRWDGVTARGNPVEVYTLGVGTDCPAAHAECDAALTRQPTPTITPSAREAA